MNIRCQNIAFILIVILTPTSIPPALSNVPTPTRMFFHAKNDIIKYNDMYAESNKGVVLHNRDSSDVIKSDECYKEPELVFLMKPSHHIT